MKFIFALLCRFIHEYRDVLPYTEVDEDSEPELDPKTLMAQGLSNLQQWRIDPASQILTEIAEEMKHAEEEDEGRGGDGSISIILYTIIEPETHMVRELKATREFSEVEKL